MINKFLFVGLFFSILYINPSYSQDSSKTSMKKNAINIGVISIALGEIDGYYEHLLGLRHGLGINGTYMTNNDSKGYSLKLDYRYHYFRSKNNHDLKSSFWGPFLYYEKSKNNIDIDRRSYSVDYEAVKAGIQWGHRWIFLRHVNVCFDIGYGFPIFTDYKWAQGKPTNGDQLESLATIVYGLSSEISLGFAF